MSEFGSGGFRSIPLTNGKVAIVDATDFDSLIGYRWHARKGRRGASYAQRMITKNGKLTALGMHTQITGFAITDHINGDTLDNRRTNLREVTRTQNMWNCCTQRISNKSGFRGVSWQKDMGRWRARIGVSGKKIQVGFFDDPAEAARAWDAAAVKYYGEFARLNFPDRKQEAAPA